MSPVKVLIITYYWPPAGGAGVQRWVKLTKYLNRYEMIPYVLTVDERYASYMQTDKSLEQDVAPHVNVYKTQSFEPVNYYAKVVGKKRVPTAGFSNESSRKPFRKLVNTLRTHLFIPDPRRGWNRYAYRKAAALIQSEDISLVITSGPPHSTHLTGLKLQKKLRVKWIADFRDPWTDIYYYPLLGHSLFSHHQNKKLEKKVLVRSDRLITVSPSLKRSLSEKYRNIEASKIDVLPNGYDKADFKTLEKTEHEAFTVCYTGTMADTYAPSVFFLALQEVAALHPEAAIKIQITGQVTERIKEQITGTGLPVVFTGTVAHSKVVEYQKNADLLLMVIPDVERAEGIVTGKLFEYLASENPMICLGPENGDAAAIIEACAAGKTFNRNNRKGIVRYIEKVWGDFLSGKKPTPDPGEIGKFSREKQAGMIRKIADGLLAE